MCATIDQGTSHYNHKEITDYYHDHALHISVESSLDHSEVTLFCLTKKIDQALHMTEELLKNSTFPQERVDSQRHLLIEALKRLEGEPAYFAGEIFRQVSVPASHPASRPYRGTPTSLSSISVEDLKQMRAKLFHKSGLKMTIVGDITPQRKEQIVATFLGSLNDGALPPVVPDYVPQAQGQIYFYPFPSENSLVLFFHPGLKSNQEGFYPLYLANHLFGEGLSSLLMKELRIKQGLVYGISQNLTFSAFTSIIKGGTHTNHAQVDKVIDGIRNVWAQAKQTGFSAQEVEEMKSSMTGKFPLFFRTTNQVNSQLSAFYYLGFPVDFVYKRNDFVNAVTLEQTNHICQTFLDPNALTFIVVGKTPPKNAIIIRNLKELETLRASR